MKKLLFILIALASIPCKAQISGPTQTYVGGEITLQDPHQIGNIGTWSSSDNTIATIDSQKGIVTGLTGGDSLQIYFNKVGLSDTFNIYVAVEDSSGYYFETPSSNKLTEYRDCDGVTILSLITSSKFVGGQQINKVSYNYRSNSYNITILGLNNGTGNNYSITIPAIKIKDIEGFPLSGDPLEDISSISNYPF